MMHLDGTSLELAFDKLYVTINRLLYLGLEVGLQFTLQDAQEYTSWFIRSDDCVWWDHTARQYRPVRFGFRKSDPRTHRDGVWMARDGHDPVKWVLDALFEDVVGEEIVTLTSEPRIFARIVDTNIVMQDTIVDFVSRHYELAELVCPTLDTLQDVALSQLDPKHLPDVLRSGMLDAVHAKKWKPIAFPAFMV